MWRRVICFGAAVAGAMSEWRVEEATRRVCGREVENAAKLRPSPETVAWCRDAQARAGVRPGASWGSLDKPGVSFWMDSDCDSAIDGPGKSCGERWDGAVARALRSSEQVLLEPRRPGDTRIACGQVGWTRTCSLRDVVVDFTKMRDGPAKRRPRNRYFPDGRMATRVFERGFVGTRGAAPLRERLGVLPAFEPEPCGACACDVTIPGKTVAFGHDSWWNAGHMMADLLEVLTTKWIHGGRRWNFLLVDGLRPGSGNYRDENKRFYKLYDAAFDRVLRANELRNRTVCFEELVTQPTPRVDLYWSHWWNDRRCSYVAPSSLLQRYNLESRVALASHFGSATAPAPRLAVLVLDRSATGTNKGGRSLSDVPDLVRSLKRASKDVGARIDVRAVDTAAISLKEQFELFESTSIVVGVHGAGVPWATSQLPLGTATCCGVVELFPPGQYKGIRGHGNFARSLGFEFSQRDIPANKLGAKAIEGVTADVVAMVSRLRARPTCVREEVLDATRFADGAPDSFAPPTGSLGDVSRYWHARDWTPGHSQRQVAAPELKGRPRHFPRRGGVH